MDKEKETPVNIGPRVKVGPDGQLILDEQSLVCRKCNYQFHILLKQVKSSNSSLIV